MTNTPKLNRALSEHTYKVSKLLRDLGYPVLQVYADEFGSGNVSVIELINTNPTDDAKKPAKTLCLYIDRVPLGSRAHTPKWGYEYRFVAVRNTSGRRCLANITFHVEDFPKKVHKDLWVKANVAQLVVRDLKMESDLDVFDHAKLMLLIQIEDEQEEIEIATERLAALNKQLAAHKASKGAKAQA